MEKRCHLSDYLAEASKLKTKLILELKEQSSAERESEAVKKIVAMVHDMKLKIGWSTLVSQNMQ